MLGEANGQTGMTAAVLAYFSFLHAKMQLFYFAYLHINS